MILLQLLLVKWLFISCYETQKISIKSSSSQIKLGDQLTIYCTIFQPVPDVSLYFRCPNDNKYSSCFQNCDSVCEISDCSGNLKMIDYKCDKYISKTLSNYSYTIKVNQYLIENRKNLTYNCWYMDKIEEITIDIVDKKVIKYTSTPTTTKHVTNKKLVTKKPKVSTSISTTHQYSSTNSLNWVMGSMSERKKWLLGLIGALGVSFLINFMFVCIWIVNCCNERSLKKHCKNNERLQVPPESEGPNSAIWSGTQPLLMQNYPTWQDHSSAALNFNRRTRSQPTLNNSSNSKSHHHTLPLEIPAHFPNNFSQPQPTHMYNNTLYSPGEGGTMVQAYASVYSGRSLHTPMLLDISPPQRPDNTSQHEMYRPANLDVSNEQLQHLFNPTMPTLNPNTSSLITGDTNHDNKHNNQDDNN